MKMRACLVSGESRLPGLQTHHLAVRTGQGEVDRLCLFSQGTVPILEGSPPHQYYPLGD